MLSQFVMNLQNSLYMNFMFSPTWVGLLWLDLFLLDDNDQMAIW